MMDVMTGIHDGNSFIESGVSVALRAIYAQLVRSSNPGDTGPKSALRKFEAHRYRRR
jgi:hypothetical protein